MSINNYLNKIPNELKLIINNYLDYDQFNLFIYTFGELTNSDYMTLIRKKYPEIYNLNPSHLFKLNNKNIYLSFLKFNSLYKKIDILSINVFINKYKNNYKDTLIYLITNFPYDDDIKLKSVIIIDDVELYKQFYDLEYNNELIYLILSNNAYNIFKYILNFVKMEILDIFQIILEVYQIYHINLKITKLLFKTLNFTSEQILRVAFFNNPKNKLSFNFLISKLKKMEIQPYDFYELFSTSETLDIISFDKFLPLWNGWNYLLKEDQIFEVYKNYIEFIGNTYGYISLDNIKILTHIANHPNIKNSYMKWN